MADVDGIAISAGLGVVTCLLYAYVGARLSQRRVSAEARLAQQAFALWWFALAFSSVVVTVQYAAYLANGRHLDVWAFQLAGQVQLFVLMAGLTGLLYYLVFLYTGRRRSWIVLATYYVALYAFLEWLILTLPRPEAVVEQGWRLATTPQADLGLAFTLAFLVLFLGPQLAAAIAYALLYRRATDATQRYRIALVSTSIIVWFGSGFVTSAAGVSRHPYVQLFSQLLAVAAAAAILLAYQPPSSWKARWGLRSIADEVPGRA